MKESTKQNNYNKNDIDILLEAQGVAVRQYPKENINYDFMDKIAYAIQSEQKIKISYTTGKGYYYKSVIEPYGIKIADNHYLIAKEKGSLVTFKISRISELEILENEYFEKDEDFDIKKYCNQSFGIYTGEIEEVILQFSSDAAKYVLNYHFHPTQEMEKQKDGSVIVRFKASGNYEIVTELLKWRDNVKILSPDSIKENYEKTVESMYQNIKGE